jgi:hypothetical protein
MPVQVGRILEDNCLRQIEEQAQDVTDCLTVEKVSLTNKSTTNNYSHNADVLKVVGPDRQLQYHCDSQNK